MIRLKETAESFSDIHEAKEAVIQYAKKATKENTLSATLLVDAKKYLLKKPLIFDTKENPALENIHLSILCENGGGIFTSAFPLSAQKIIKKENVYTYQFEPDLQGNFPLFHDLYEGENRLKLCTSSHFKHAFAFSNENQRNNEENLEGIYIPKEIADMLPDGDLSPMTITLYVEWEFFTLHILSVDRDHTKTDETGHTHVLLKIVPDELYHYVMGMNSVLQPKDRECFLSNHPVFLKEPAFCYDHKKGYLQWIPQTENEKIFVPNLERLFEFNGMDGVTLKNLIFTGVTDRYLCNHGYLSMQANVEKRGLIKIPEAAVLTNHTRGLTISGCEFKSLGVNGILMCGISARVNIYGNYFHDIGMSAISIGDPVRASSDPQNASFDLRVHRNDFYHIAYEFPSAPAIDIFRVDGLSICYNNIRKTAYSAISVGWQWSSVPYALGEVINIRDAELAYNKITDFMQILRDGAAIYVVGANCARTYSRRFNSIHHNFAENDRIRKHAFGYYLDGASSNWDVYDNVISKAERPVYMQHNSYIPQQYTWHNRAYRIYCTEEIVIRNHHPERDTLLGQIYMADTIDALLETYPQAKEIYENAGLDGKEIF